MRKFLILSFFIALTTSNLFGQKEMEEGEKKSFKDRVYFGGNLGLSFGTYTYVDVSPLVGYMITEKFSSGLGITYRYLRDNDFDYSTNIYGGRVFGRHNIGRSFFAHVEYENLNAETVVIRDGLARFDRNWVPAFFVGGGLFQGVGKAGISITVLYNLLYNNRNSLYASPFVVRAGITL